MASKKNSSVFVVTVPERYRFDSEDRPFPTFHPDGFIEVTASNETQARKFVRKALGGEYWADLRLDHGDGAYFPDGRLARVFKSKDGVEIEVVS